MKTHIKYTNVRYDYDRDVTTCTISYTLRMSHIKNIKTILSLDFIKKFIERNKKKYSIVGWDEELCTFYFRTSASSKPMEGDRYDLGLGKEIALTKAKKNTFYNAFYFVYDLEDYLMTQFGKGIWTLEDRILQTASHYAERYSKYVEPEEIDIEKELIF